MFQRSASGGGAESEGSSPALDMAEMDPRLADALRRFAAHEVALFAPTPDLASAGADGAPLDPTAVETYRRFAAYLALHRLDVPVVSYDDAFVSERDAGPIAIDGAAFSVGDEPLADVESARVAAAEAAESASRAAEIGARALKPRVLLTRAQAEPGPVLADIERFGKDALRLFTRDPGEVSARSGELGRAAHLFQAMRDAPRAAGQLFDAQIDLVFVCRGAWRRSPRADAAVAVRLADLRAALPGADLRFQVWGEAELIRAYERVALAAVGVLRGARLMALPRIASKNGAASGWLGLSPAASIAELIIGEDGLPDPRLFYDNVRHYLGENARSNPGAAGLAETLDEGEGAELVLRHNGVTIVARGAELVEEDGVADVLLREFQIVNGAQTAFTLFARRDDLGAAAVPVKIVVTEEERIKDGVVLGANTQAAVDRFDMLARRPELRALHHAFETASASSPAKLWLQRRREEPFRGRVSAQRVVTPRQLMEGFGATVMAAPHRVHDNAAQLLDEVPEKIFHPEHPHAVYLAIGWLIVVGRRWAERQGLRWADRLGEGRSDAYPARHQFLYALFRMVDEDPDDPDVARAAETEGRFRAMIDLFIARDGAALADLAGVIVSEAAGGRPLTHELVRKSAFTDAVRELVDDARAQLRRDGR